MNDDGNHYVIKSKSLATVLSRAELLVHATPAEDIVSVSLFSEETKKGKTRYVFSILVAD